MPNQKNPYSELQPIARRDFLAQAGGGIGGLALACLLEQEGVLGQTPANHAAKPQQGNPLAPHPPHPKLA